ncbi:hypothetical protein AXF42_Ash003971 [Apostasia shenzhenica]|uniref:Uncharacterized protein n=1 Tax=Apostasia shenzhenica TaxID=1088818 RepID=A0A2I0AIE8_9ASPA|nr:hypothetical protein AXF42_Ash003971 [Apostasia shenzhenica]
MPEAISEQLSLFHSQIEKGRFSDVSLRLLESVLIAKDVRSLLAIRSSVQELLRSKAASVMDEVAGKTIDEKLRIADFFVKAFALVGDAESCLALRYEALVLRETKYHNRIDFRVSHEEWCTFAKDSFDSGYYSIALKGFDSALACFQSEKNMGRMTNDFHAKDHVIDVIKKLRDEAAVLISSSSVHSLSAKYLKRKATKDEQQCKILSTGSQHVASLIYRAGINRRNMHKLWQRQQQQLEVTGPSLNVQNVSAFHYFNE